jgi:hypothetical protein
LRAVPGGALEEVALAVHELAAEARHLLLHLLHLGVEALADVGELGVDDAEVAELNGNVALDAAVRHCCPFGVSRKLTIKTNECVGYWGVGGCACASGPRVRRKPRALAPRRRVPT